MLMSRVQKGPIRHRLLFPLEKALVSALQPPVLAGPEQYFVCSFISPCDGKKQFIATPRRKKLSFCDR